MSDPSLLSPEYKGNKLLTFTAIFVPTQIIAVGLRYVARYLIEGPWGLDDVFVMTSLALQMCMAGLSIGRRMDSCNLCELTQSTDTVKALSITPELVTTCLTWRR